MKKTIIAIAAVLTFATGNSFAQQYRNYNKSVVVANNQRSDNAYEEYQINRLDKIVGLTRKQENKIKKIENKYDRLLSNRRNHTFQSVKRMEQQKEQEILSVLTPVQRQRLVAFQRSSRTYNRRG